MSQRMQRFCDWPQCEKWDGVDRRQIRMVDDNIYHFDACPEHFEMARGFLIKLEDGMERRGAK